MSWSDISLNETVRYLRTPYRANASPVLVCFPGINRVLGSPSPNAFVTWYNTKKLPTIPPLSLSAVKRSLRSHGHYIDDYLKLVRDTRPDIHNHNPATLPKWSKIIPLPDREVGRSTGIEVCAWDLKDNVYRYYLTLKELLSTDIKVNPKRLSLDLHYRKYVSSLDGRWILSIYPDAMQRLLREGEVLYECLSHDTTVRTLSLCYKRFHTHPLWVDALRKLIDYGDTTIGKSAIERLG